MRIVFIGPFGIKPKSTMAVRALPLAKSLARRGHELALVLPPFHDPAAAELRWSEDGVLLDNVAVSRFPLLGYLITACRLVRHALALKPDVIACFKPKGYSGLALWLLWWWWKPARRPIPLILDSDDWEGWGGWNDLEPYPRWQKRFFAWQEQWGLRHADVVTVASRALQTIAWSMGISPDRVRYLPNGARDQTPAVAEPETLVHQEERPPTILLYTRFFEFDVQRVVSLLQQVRCQIETAHLLVVGKGFYGEEERLRAAAAAAGLTDAIEYAGWVEEDQLPAYFCRADCAIYPFDDTLINRTKCAVKLIDLLAAGVPVVAEAVGQNQVYIEHGRSGLLAPPGNEGDMAAAVVDLLQQPELRRTLAAGARQRIADHFTWDTLSGEFEQLCHSLLRS